MSVEERIAEIIRANCGKKWDCYEDIPVHESLIVAREILALEVEGRVVKYAEMHYVMQQKTRPATLQDILDGRASKE